ncbi:MFS transporter [Bradyrhizobium sp. 31Argb]|uniref:MFS transporter n=1 Tax=Bradyrhizobium sp. 31Argb TaxID=3141247 RepID=UPI003747E81A
MAAPIAGALADKRGPAVVISIGAGLVVVAFAIFGLFQGSLAAIVIGVLVLDLAVQASQVANQARIFALDPAARSRLNTIFMGTMILGGACGAGVAGLAYACFGWTGACIFGATAAAIALVMSRAEARDKVSKWSR